MARSRPSPGPGRIFKYGADSATVLTAAFVGQKLGREAL